MDSDGSTKFLDLDQPKRGADYNEFMLIKVAEPNTPYHECIEKYHKQRMIDVNWSLEKLLDMHYSKERSGVRVKNMPIGTDIAILIKINKNKKGEVSFSGLFRTDYPTDPSAMFNDVKNGEYILFSCMGNQLNKSKVIKLDLEKLDYAKWFDWNDLPATKDLDDFVDTVRKAFACHLSKFGS